MTQAIAIAITILTVATVILAVALACTRRDLDEFRSDLTRYWFVSAVYNDGTTHYSALPGTPPPPFEALGGNPRVTVTHRRGGQPSGIRFDGTVWTDRGRPE